MGLGFASKPLFPLQAIWLRLSQLFEKTELPTYALETKPLWLSCVLETPPQRQSNTKCSVVAEFSSELVLLRTSRSQQYWVQNENWGALKRAGLPLSAAMPGSCLKALISPLPP